MTAELDAFKKQVNTKLRDITNHNRDLDECTASTFARITTLIEFDLVEAEEIINLLKTNKYNKQEIQLLEGGFKQKKEDYLHRRSKAEESLMFPTSSSSSEPKQQKLSKKAQEYQERNKLKLQDSEAVVQDSNRIGEATLAQLQEQGQTLQNANEKVSFFVTQYNNNNPFNLISYLLCF